MRQLMDFLAVHAHPCYLDGLLRTGIEVDRIPEISFVSAKLEKFGWRAIPVSGFIPPAAFMELQSLGFLPIASDMRAIDHLMYTPAPDIVHEAAGHAPILIDEEFAGYLRDYALVARKAIISFEDMNQYEAIRVLSDLKEDPNSTAAQVAEAEKKLDHVTRSISFISEAAYLSRMNWWTAEYGLIGTMDNPKIFGAGLLSSVGEARECLLPKVKKIPMTIDCLNYSYDITEKQPQLFVTPSFQHLRVVLDELAKTMAYRTGGVEALEKAKLAQTVNTVELNSGLQISGRLKTYIALDNEPIYLQFEGPTQLCETSRELSGHGKFHHLHGFGSPVGRLTNTTKCLSEYGEVELKHFNIEIGKNVSLNFLSGVQVVGTVQSTLRGANGRLLVISLDKCTVTQKDKILFDPAWGIFDMAIGSNVPSVYGGPADRKSYGDTDDFVAKMIPRKNLSASEQKKHALYAELRTLRALLNNPTKNFKVEDHSNDDVHFRFEKILIELNTHFSTDWLLYLNLYELVLKYPNSPIFFKVKAQLEKLKITEPNFSSLINDGLRLLN